jgi:repressor LexA
MSDLTEKQKRIYDFILGRVRDGELSPTLREIGRRFGVSVGTAQDQVAALVAKGFIKRQGGGAS